MTTPLDSALVPAVASVLGRVGVSATLTPAPVLDASTGSVTTASALSTTATPPQVSSAYASAEGAVIVGATVSYVLPDTAPEVGGLLTIGGDVWKITAVRAMRTGDAIAAYRVEVSD